MICHRWDLWEAHGTNTDASYARVLRTLVAMNGKMMGSYCTDHGYRYACVVYSIEIPEGRDEEFKQLTHCDLNRHPDIQVGRSVVKSVKKIIHDNGIKKYVYDLDQEPCSPPNDEL